MVKLNKEKLAAGTKRPPLRECVDPAKADYWQRRRDVTHFRLPEVLYCKANLGIERIKSDGCAKVAVLALYKRVSVGRLVYCQIEIRFDLGIDGKQPLAPLYVPFNLFGAVPRQIEHTNVKPVPVIEPIVAVNSEYVVGGIEAEVALKIRYRAVCRPAIQLRVSISVRQKNTEDLR